MLAARALPIVYGILLVLFTIVGLQRSDHAHSLHDFDGGRLPIADSGHWVSGSIGATEGVKQPWTARRPLNVSFNAPFYRAAERLGADPLRSALLLKRSLALACIIALLLTLRAVFSAAVLFCLGLLLLSVLFDGTMSRFSALLGNAVGYTHGTELNGYIIVLAALSCLVAARLARGRSGRPRSLQVLAYAPGLLLLSLATLLRPGTLLLLPLVGLALLMGESSRTPRTLPVRQRRIEAPLLLLVLLGSIGAARLVELSAFRAISDPCGALGGNQGYTIYGISQGGRWELGRDLGRALMQREGIPRCERILNPILSDLGKRAILANPRPFLRIVHSNIRWRLQAFTSNRRQLLFSLLVGLVLLLPRSRARVLAAMRADPTLTTLLLVALAGCLAMELFEVLFLNEAWIRPQIAYVVFAALLIAVLLELGRRAILPNAAAVLPAPAAALPWRPSVSVAGCLFLLLACGTLMVSHPAQARPEAADRLVRGQFLLAHLDWQQDWRLRGLDEFFEVAIPTPLQPGYRDVCVLYARRRFPARSELGRITLRQDTCPGA